MRRALFGIALALVVSFFLPSIKSFAMRKDPLVGKWKISVEPDDDARKSGEKTFTDTLVFQGGKFTALACEKHGFKPVEYTDDTRGMTTATFVAEPVSEKEGKAKWTGSVTATAITGTMTWTKKDGSVLQYSYSGERDDNK